MSKPQRRPPIKKKVRLSVSWSPGPRTLQWDALWARLLSYALTSLPQFPEVEEAVVTADEVNGTGGDNEVRGPGRPAAG